MGATAMNALTDLHAERARHRFETAMPGPLRRDLEFILSIDGLAPKDRGVSGLLRSTTAMVPGKLALLALLVTGALALLGRPYGVVDKERRAEAARREMDDRYATPSLVRLNRGGGAGPTVEAGERVAAPRLDAAQPPSRPGSTGGGAAYVRSGTSTHEDVAGGEQAAAPAPVPKMPDQPVVTPAPRFEAAAVPTPKLSGASPKAVPATPAAGSPGIGFSRPQPARPTVAPATATPATPSDAERREALDAMRDLRRQW